MMIENVKARVAWSGHSQEPLEWRQKLKPSGRKPLLPGGLDTEWSGAFQGSERVLFSSIRW